MNAVIWAPPTGTGARCGARGDRPRAEPREAGPGERPQLDLVRPPRLTDGERGGGHRTGYLKLGPKESISRADLAGLMLAGAAKGRFVNEAPMGSY
jgi:hypothetical protein